MPIEVNALESKRFGITAGRVLETEASPVRINACAQALGIQMLSIRVGTDHTQRVQQLEEDGFRLMDTLVYYDRRLTGDLLPLPAVPGEIIRLATPGDVTEVTTVSAHAFADYFGHYHADPRLSNSAADAAYVEWAKNSVAGCDASRPAYVVVQDGCIVGFMTVQLQPDRSSEIILNAVHPDVQGTGVYGRLLAWVIHALQSAGCETLRISTQINNIAVQRAWGRCGLRMSHSFYTLHKWYAEPGG